MNNGIYIALNLFEFLLIFVLNCGVRLPAARRNAAQRGQFAGCQPGIHGLARGCFLSGLLRRPPGRYFRSGERAHAFSELIPVIERFSPQAGIIGRDFDLIVFRDVADQPLTVGEAGRLGSLLILEGAVLAKFAFGGELLLQLVGILEAGGFEGSFDLSQERALTLLILLM